MAAVARAAICTLATRTVATETSDAAGHRHGQLAENVVAGDRQVRGIEDTTAECRASAAAGTTGASLTRCARSLLIDAVAVRPKPPRPPAPPSPPWARLAIIVLLEMVMEPA